MCRFFSLLAFCLITISTTLLSPLEARCYQTNVSVGGGMNDVEPVSVARSYPPGHCGGCPRYARRVPPVYAYPHTTYHGPPGVVYDEIYPYPPCCGGLYY